MDRGSPSGGIFNPYASVMQGYDTSCDSKAKPDAFVYARIAIVGSLKGKEYLFLHVILDADAIVDNLDFNHVALSRAAGDCNGSTVRRELNGIGDEIDEYLAHLGLIPAYS